MSRMMRSDRKPPLSVRSPVRLRPRGPAQPSVNALQTPSGSLMKTGLPKHSHKTQEPELRPEYQMISSELQALTKMVQDNLWGSTNANQPAKPYLESPLFKRGRFYEEYSARRNEKLKRKRGESTVEKKTPAKRHLGVRIESANRTGEVKKVESARKMTTPMVERKEVTAATTATTQRYSLRSSYKENKKPPLAMSFDRSPGGTVEKKATVRRTARKGY